MGKHKKKFIDKKEAVSFHLIHRSQRDPLQVDTDSPARILHPVSSGKDHAAGPSDKCHEDESPLPLSRREENAKYGIYYDDSYDYMQHLRTRGTGVLVLDESSYVNNKPKPMKEFGTNLKLPSEVFASEYEEDEGMLSKGVLPRGPQPDWDPDVVACLDDAIDLDDPENILEDDFVFKANAHPHETAPDMFRGEFDEESGSDYYDSDDENSSDFSLPSDGERSEGTRFSMTSSVLRRTKELQILDDRLDRILEEYDDEEIGGLDGEDISGHVDADELLERGVMDDLIKGGLKTIDEIRAETLTNSSDTVQVQEKYVEEKSDSEVEPVDRLETKEKEQWDCESILSTYSTLYNHPKLICEPKGKNAIRLTKKLGIPVGVIDNKKPEQHDTDKNSLPPKTNMVRTKNETADEKKLRKQAVKEERRIRRSEKKATKQMFKSEQMKQERVIANAKAQQGLKI